MKVISLEKVDGVYQARVRTRRWIFWTRERVWLADNNARPYCQRSANPWHLPERYHRRWQNADRVARCNLCVWLDSEVERIEEARGLAERVEDALDEVIDLDSERSKRKKGGGAP